MAVRFALPLRLWLAALVEVPVVGDDRTDLVAGLYAGWAASNRAGDCYRVSGGFKGPSQGPFYCRLITRTQSLNPEPFAPGGVKAWVPVFG